MNLHSINTGSATMLRMSHLSKYLVAAFSFLLGVMLIAAIYFTRLDLQWIAFLVGVLFAGVAAMASQTAKSQWLVLRRTRQLKRSKELLAAESARCQRSTQELKIVEERYQLVNDALSVMILFIDRDEICRYHNRAFQQWCGRTNDMIDGIPLHAVVGGAAYQDLKSHSIDVQKGREVHYDALWLRYDGARKNLSVTLLPYPPGTLPINGFYALIEQMAGTSS
jgi:PAS domain S-box-containing protein